MHARLSPSVAGSPAKPGHWQFGYSPRRLHISSHSGPRFASLAWIRARRPMSWSPSQASEWPLSAARSAAAWADGAMARRRIAANFIAGAREDVWKRAGERDEMNGESLLEPL